MHPPPLLRPLAWRLLLATGTLGLVSACADQAPLRSGKPVEQFKAEMAAERPPAPAAPPPAAAASAAGTVRPGAGTIGLPGAPATGARPEGPSTRAEVPSEPRFDLIVNGAPARDVFLSLVADTRYSMVMHPEVGGQLSLTLRAVTVREALDSIRDVYGYDYRMDGRRITVYPPTMQTRLFTVNYLTASRDGRSEVRVSGSTAPANTTNGSGGYGTPGAPVAGGGTTTVVPDSSRVTTSTASNYWVETTEALRSMLGKGEGRFVIASPQAGTLAVRGMPDELRQVEAFLRASRLAIERQVMLEAKIIQVELRDGFQSGIDWSVLKTQGAVGQTSGYPNNPLLTNNNGLPTLPAAAQIAVDAISLPAGAGGTLGLSLATKGFQAVLGFLETQGDLQVLSSPRVATLNNQKAVLKVGIDEYFVTNVSGGSITPVSGNTTATTTLPTLTLTPFFSGIALDVTPQIDDGHMITLHLRPSVTKVTEKTKQIDLGAIGNYKLPLASSKVNETDTIVRVADGNIVAIGGLMTNEMDRNRSGLPGTGDTLAGRTLLGNVSDSGRKLELVVLIKPTIIRSDEDWQRATDQALAAMEVLPDGPRRVIALDGRSPAGGASASAGSAAATPGGPAAATDPAAPAAGPEAAAAGMAPTPTPTPTPAAATASGKKRAASTSARAKPMVPAPAAVAAAER